uniref:Uncharacterized protein n=1 Tax=Anguilla anguilla TaxID=7936 RepID=A0A0E9Q290_ANGAN
MRISDEKYSGRMAAQILHWRRDLLQQWEPLVRQDSAGD